jgi:hypothetical protein
VVEGDISCRVAHGVMNGFAYNRLPGAWICTGPDAYVECFNLDPATGEAGETIRAHVHEDVLRRWRAAEAK